MTTENVIYTKSVNVICDTDDHYMGCNLLYQTFNRLAGTSTSVKYQRSGKVYILNESTPLSWQISSPLLERRQYFSSQTAEKVAAPVEAFLKANGLNVERGNIDLNKDWPDANTVNLYTNGSKCDPHASDLPTLVMLPATYRHVWELVRNQTDRPKFA